MIRLRRLRAGFTAEELIAVLGIIMLLVLGFFWTTRNVTAMARMTACASNIKQLSHACRMYMADHTGRMPTGDDPVIPLMAYSKNEQVFLCPSAQAVRREEPDGQAHEEEPSWGWEVDWRPMYEYTYEFNLQARSDDPAPTLIVRDNSPVRHVSRTWLGGRIDGAVQRYDADDYHIRWGRQMQQEGVIDPCWDPE